MISKEKRLAEARRKRRINRRTKKDELKKWVTLIKKKDKNKCAICGKKSKSPRGLNAHHIIPKTIIITATDPQNGITLCAQHHRLGQYAVHQNALFFSYWLKKNRAKQYTYLMGKLNRMSKTK